MLTPEMIARFNKVMGENVPLDAGTNPVVKPVKSRADEIREIGAKALAEKQAQIDPRIKKTLDPGSEYPRPTLQDVSDKVSSIFPGQKVGQAIGTLAGAAISKAKGTYDNYDLSAPTPLQVAGDVGQGALTVAAPGIGGETVGARIGANAALGAGIGATGAIANKKGIGDVAKSSLEGGLLGGAASGIGEVLSALTKNLPSWLTRGYLSKLKPGTEEDALNRISLGSPTKMLEKSTSAVKSYEDQVQSILNHPQYEEETGKVGNAISDVIDNHSDAELNPKKVVNILKQVAPNSKAIVQKVANGEATLAEQNALRKELDIATRKAYTDNPNLSFSKKVGKTMADFLRNNVQSTATETEPIFSEYSKEMNVNSALRDAVSKSKPKITLTDIAAGMTGYKVGGLSGAGEAVLAEKILRNPSTGVAAAKGAQALGRIEPAVSALVKGTKAPIIKSVTSD